MKLTPILTDAATRREHIHQKAIAGIETVFPLVHKNVALEVKNVHVLPKEYSSRDQKEAILYGRTLQEPLRADLFLKDAKGKILDQKKNVTLAQLPYFTQRHTFIVDGNEYSVAHQRRVLPGVYTRVRRNEALEAAFNLGRGENFRINMDPEKGHMFMQYGTTNIPLYPILKSLGVNDTQLNKHWGAGVVATNREAFGNKQTQSLEKLYTRLTPEYKRTAKTPEEMAQAVHEAYKNTMIDPSVTERTLGARFSQVNPPALLKASQKLLEVHREGRDTDDRDSLAFQSLHSVDDFLKERIQLEGRNVSRKIKAKLSMAGKAPTLDAIMPVSPFSRSLRSFMTTSSLSAIPTQINPMEIIDSAVRVTNLGEGGISSERAVPSEARSLHHTHFGLLDPARSPESFKIGIDLRSALWTKRDETGRMYTLLRNAKTGFLEDVPVQKIEASTLAFPGELKKTTGLSALRQGELVSVPKKEVHYELPHPSFMFGPSTNTVPFPESIQGNRTLMGSKHCTQALPLIHREEPLVQVASYNPGRTFERELADLVVPTSPVDGVVKKIDKDYIYIQPEQRKKSHETKAHWPLVTVEHVAVEEEKRAAAAPLIKIPYDDHFPLAAKTYLHNTLTVKAGDTVDAHQHLAESNFTRGGKLALGKNLTVAYLPYYGYNSNDAFVISESASQKLISEHMYKEALPLDNDIVLDKKKHQAQFGLRWSATQYANLDERGIAKKGTTVHPGDPLVLALRKTAPSAEQQMLGRLHKTLATPFREMSVVWDHRNEGVVNDVIVTDARVLVTVKTQESAAVGDKLCFTQDTDVLTAEGWKAVEDITVHDTVYTIKNDIIELQGVEQTHHYPSADALYELDSRFVSLRVTPNHRLYVRSAPEVPWSLIVAQEALRKTVQHKKDGIWSAPTPETWTFHKEGTLALTVPLLPWLRFVGRYLAQNLPLTSNLDRFAGNSVHVYLQTLGQGPERHAPPELFTYGPEAARAFLEGFLDVDTLENMPDIFQVSIKSARLAADLQRLSLHAGLSAVCVKDRMHFITSYNTPTINPGGIPAADQIEHTVPSDEPVWGITVPNGTLYVRVGGKPVWTGNSGRYGNKGVISKIVPDGQMVRTQKGELIDVLLPPVSVVSRVNPAQIIETAVAKVAKKTGEPIAVPSMPGRNNVQWAKDLLKKHGLTDKEVLYNPLTHKAITGQDGKGVMVGPQYMYKLFKSTETNYSARSIGDYDVNLQPAKGGNEGSKSIGQMEFSALLAHNARNVLRESAALKSSKNDAWWRAYQLGQPLPPLRTPFAVDKFANMLTGAGIKVDKQGHHVTFGAMTDNDIKKLSSGAIQKATMIREKDFAPEKGGLFDPVITGGTMGNRWAHVDLHEPIVNPIFEDPVRRLLDMTQNDYRKTIHAEGGAGIKKRLMAFDVAAKKTALETDVKNATGTKLDNAIKQLKVLNALEKQNLKPHDAFILTKFPIVPPVVRPIVPSRGKRDLLIADANYFYRDVMLANDNLADAKKNLPPEERGAARMHLYDTTRAAFGLDEAVSPQLKGRGAKGFISTISGQGSPKWGYFQSKLLKRPQDLSARGTIVPDLNLNMDEVGLPKEMLWKSYEPHLMRQLVLQGYKALDAQKMIAERHSVAHDALLREIKQRPVVINRAPTLHRFSMVGAYAVPVEGKSIRINPFIEKGLNADYDGDSIDCCLDIFRGEIYTRLHISQFPKVEASMKQKDNKEIYTVPPGVRVFSYDNATHTICLKEVTEFSVHHNLEMLEVIFTSGRAVKVSRDASLFVLNPQTWSLERACAENVIGWATPRPRTLHREQLKTTKHTTEDAGWFFGALTGNGWIMYDDRDCRGIGFASIYPTLKDRFTMRAEDFVPELSRRDYESDHVFRGYACYSEKIHLNSTALGHAMLDLGLTYRNASEKFLPPMFIDAPREFHLGLLAGLLDTDGSITCVKAQAKNKPQWLVNYSTVSEVLSDQIALLATFLGVKSGINYNADRACYVITLSMPDIARIGHELHLTHPEKAKNLRALCRDFDPTATSNHRNDAVPISPNIAQTLLQFTGCPKKRDTPEKKAAAVYYQILRKAKTTQRIPRESLLRCMALLTQLHGPQLISDSVPAPWLQTVTNEALLWDFVDVVTPLPGRHTAWDLTVPGSNTFMTSNQVVVYDTVQIHVPATDEAMHEVRSMTLSNLLFGDKTKSDLMVFPQHEAIMGIYAASSAKGGKAHSFKTEADAIAAYQRGDVKLNDEVKIG